MFNFSSDDLQRVLNSQTQVFNYLHGAGDTGYECKEITRGIYRERKHRSEVPVTFVSNKAENKSHDHQTNKRIDIDKLFQSYKLETTTGTQWTRWRSPNVSINKEVPFPPSADLPYTELMVDIHEEKMECLCFDLEEAPMSLTS